MRRSIFSLIAAAMLLLVSFTVYAERYEVSCNELTISNAGGERKFYVSCDNIWTVTTDVDWISVYPSTGKAGSDSIIVLTVKQNTTGANRKATVSFSANGRTAEIPLDQVDVSSEYWHDGDLIPAHLHKKVSDGGTMPDNYRPVCVLLFGNGWDLKDNKKGGLYEQFAKGWADLFLQQDIFKEMQDYFDIYAYVSESNQRGNIPFSAYKYSIGGNRDMDKLGSDATFALLKIGHPNAKSAVNVDITNGSVGGWNFYFSNRAGGSGQYAAFGNPQGEQWGQYWWTHEFMGHDFGNMPDYYGPYSDGLDWTKEKIKYTSIQFGTGKIFERTGEYPNCYEKAGCGTVINAIQVLVRDWDNGYWWNTDWESDPEKVIWKTFIGRNGYDNVGVFNGGNTGLGGVDNYKRPEDHNVMNENWGSGGLDCKGNIWHDVGSRFWIWNKVLERSGVGSPRIISNPDPTHPRSLENFIHFDTINNYNANGKRVCKYDIPDVLTAPYWTANSLFAGNLKGYRDWIAECTISQTGGKIVLKDGVKTLTEGTDYTKEDLGNGNFTLFRGLGKYSGTLKYKNKTGSELIYAGNGGAVRNLPVDNSLYSDGETVTIPFNPAPTWEGNTFLGYAKSATATIPEFTESGSKTVTINGNTVLYGVWETTVNFDSNGGNSIPAVTTIVGTKIAAPANPSKEGYVFIGWYADAGFKTAWDFNQRLVTDATTIYAKWVTQSSGNYISLDDPTETVSGTGWSLDKNVYTITDGADILIKGTNNVRSIVVASGATATITLEDVSIVLSKNFAPLTVTNANVTLLLKGTNTLTASATYNHAAIEQGGSGSLVINNADATAGVLYATGGKFSAGIGGQYNKGCGSILISGGVVFASSDPTESASSHGAGIGGGRYGKGGDITINGGVVAAVSKKPGVAIGNGETGSINTITINGGTVYASAGNARPIGNGGDANGTGVTIGGKAIVFMTSNDNTLPFVGTIEPGAVVRQEITESESFLTIIQNSVDIKIEDTGLDIPQDAILGIPTGSTLSVGVGITLNNYGRILAGSINNVEQTDGKPYGNILGWYSGARGNINTAIRQIETAPVVNVYLDGELVRINAEGITGVTVYSISGQVVSSANGAVTSLPAPSAKGIYVVRVATTNGIVAKKIVK
ncbi:MAG: InlB B-repeat-containing protein [Dysgonamonadaceae bacterium]|jgi:uncharacterized repeat protein (TIGR02543 family)|nr:InlB B-repeat-containing protein [Dysgonamonadaceae bacterium]